MLKNGHSGNFYTMLCFISIKTKASPGMFVDDAYSREASLRVQDSADLGWGPGNLRRRTSRVTWLQGFQGTRLENRPAPPPAPTAMSWAPALVAPGNPQRHLLTLLRSLRPTRRDCHPSHAGHREAETKRAPNALGAGRAGQPGSLAAPGTGPLVGVGRAPAGPAPPRQGPGGPALPARSLRADQDSGPRRAGPGAPPPLRHTPAPTGLPALAPQPQGEGSVPPGRPGPQAAFRFPERLSAPRETPQAGSSLPAHLAAPAIHTPSEVLGSDEVAVPRVPRGAGVGGAEALFDCRGWGVGGLNIRKRMLSM